MTDKARIRAALQDLSLEDVEAVRAYAELLNNRHSKINTAKRIRWDRVLFVVNVVAAFAFVISNLLIKLHYLRM